MLKPKYKNMTALVEEYRHLMVDLGAVKQAAAKQEKAEAKPVVEAKEPVRQPSLAERAPLSRYTTSKKAIDSFRVLAGIEEREIMPWDPGLSGTTKFDDGLLAEANAGTKKK